LQRLPQKRIKNSQKRGIFTQKQVDFYNKYFQVSDIQQGCLLGFDL